MRSGFAVTLIGVQLVACVSLGVANDDELGGPVLLARLDEVSGPSRTLFLYFSDQPRAVHVWLGDGWVPAEKVRDPSREEPYYAYRVPSRFNPMDSPKVFVNSWAMSGELTYCHELQLHRDNGDYRVPVEFRSVLSRRQYLANQQSLPQEGAIPEAPDYLAPETRTLIKAVRETGAQSVQGRLDPELVRMAMRYARSMANQQRQDGHAGWSQRFQYLIRQGGGGGAPSEITAESWSHIGSSLDAHARSCVESWLQSPGHRAEMMRYHGRYGYAMARGNNGVYYAVGIFAN